MSREDRVKEIAMMIGTIKGVSIDWLTMDRKISGQNIYAPHPLENFLSSLPELQQGRKLTAEDIERAETKKKLNVFSPVWYEHIAAELNKIRAPKAETTATFNHVIKQRDDAEKERDELKCAVTNRTKERDEARNDAHSLSAKLELSIKERDELKADVRRLEYKLTDAVQNWHLLEDNQNTQPSIGVTADQIKAAIEDATGSTVCNMRECEKIAAALSPKWLDPIENPPVVGQKVYWLTYDKQVIEGGHTVAFSNTKVIIGWQPRYVPQPPVEEESEQIKLIKKAIAVGTADYSATHKEIIEIVKQFEKGAK